MYIKAKYGEVIQTLQRDLLILREHLSITGITEFKVTEQV